MERFVVISSDCHWGDSVEQYRPYMERKYLEDFDRYVAHQKAHAGEVIAAAASDKSPEDLRKMGFDDMDHRRHFSHSNDNKLRIKDLESDGVVGEVVFPNTVVPFASSFAMTRTEYPLELQLAGERAYNRALAEFIDPDRQVGLALISYADIDAAVKEVRWARSAGLKGVLVGSVQPGLPKLGLDPYYEPLWKACVDEGLPVHIHGGAGAEIDTRPGAVQVWATEALFYGQRALWFLIWGGVPERHPDLQVVFTELMSDWQARALKFMDWMWKGSSLSQMPSLITMPPSEYWKRQFHCGSSILSSIELADRHEIGVDKMMFGSDFPHPEGTWGKTPAYLQAAFGGGRVPEDEARKILGDNAIRLYGLDRAKLESAAQRVGPLVSEVLSDPGTITDPHVKNWLARPVGVA
jgi:predicted TIM-barrel fold metal-dependent hydrolase